MQPHHFLLLSATAAPIIRHTGEHHIGSVLIWELVLHCADWPSRRLLGRRWRRRPSRRGRKGAVSLGDSCKPVALSGGMV